MVQREMVRRVAIILAIVLILLGGGYFAYQQLVPPPDKEAKGPVYSTRPVTRGNISVGVDATGPLNPSRGGGIQVPGGGPMPFGLSNYLVEQVLVKEGDAVTQGQVLVRLSAAELQTRIRDAEKQLRSDRQSLAEMMGVPPDQLDRIDPGKGITLRAPIDGRVVGLSVKEGQELKQGQIVAWVVDDSRFRVTAKLAPVEFPWVKTGDRVVLGFSQFDGWLEGRVTDVNPSPVPEAVSELQDTYPSSGQGSKLEYQFVYWATLEGANTGLIRPGMLARVGLPSGEQATEIRWLRYYARVEGYVKEEQVLSGADAIATRVYVREMQKVKAGDKLVALTGEDARQKVQEQLERIREKEAELSRLRVLLGQLEIRAPMDGTVANIEVQAGQMVEPGRWLGSIYNTDDMQMWVQVDDVNVVLVKTGAPVRVTVAALPGRTLEGEVTNVSTMGKDERGIARFGVNIRVKGSPELKPGMQAEAHIDAGSAENVLLVPVEAIFEEDGQPKVEVLQPDGTPKVVAVKLGLMNDRVAEVKSGLEEGQLVITGSTADILPGERLRTQDGLFPGQQGGNNSQRQPQGGSGGGEGRGGSPGATKQPVGK